VSLPLDSRRHMIVSELHFAAICNDVLPNPSGIDARLGCELRRTLIQSAEVTFTVQWRAVSQLHETRIESAPLASSRETIPMLPVREAHINAVAARIESVDFRCRDRKKSLHI
jgi:hypothetical protein